MKREEFTSKFKVGDLITNDLWLSSDHLQDPSGEIVFIDEDEFCVKDRDGLTVCRFEEHIWQHYKEPVKKDLEGLKKFYSVSYENGEIKSVNLGYSRSKFENTYWDKELICEYITEEEAIERGLKI